MEKFEEDARKRTLKRRQKIFRTQQLVSLAEIALNTGVAIMRAYKDYTVVAAHPIAAMIGALGAIQAGTVLAQKPPQFAKGGDFVTDGPQMIMVGDNPGGRERVQVTPLSSPNINGPQSGAINITFSGNVMSDTFIEDEAIPKIREAIRRGSDIGDF